MAILPLSVLAAIAAIGYIGGEYQKRKAGREAAADAKKTIALQAAEARKALLEERRGKRQQAMLIEKQTSESRDRKREEDFRTRMLAEAGQPSMETMAIQQYLAMQQAQGGGIARAMRRMEQ